MFNKQIINDDEPCKFIKMYNDIILSRFVDKKALKFFLFV